MTARPWSFGALVTVIVLAGSCAVAVQYAMKMIVDAMSDGRNGGSVWTALALFMSLIVVESISWRLSGWVGCRRIVDACARIRVDLFDHLSHHSAGYFSCHHSGALGNRISGTANSAAAIYSAVTWNIVPPCVDFVGAVAVLAVVEWRMAVVLVSFVALTAVTLIGFGAKGRDLHQHYGNQLARVSGEIIDTISNIWTVQVFTGHIRERMRLEHEVAVEAAAQRRSWMYVEAARVIHDVFLWIMTGVMLVWVLRSWTAGTASAGDVVVVSALSFRILHGSRDLALALVATSQHFGVIREMLDVIAKPHETPDRPGARDLVWQGGRIDVERVSYHYTAGKPALRALDLSIPAGQRVGIVGLSGAGKSTLLAMLQRAYQPTSGRILVDGQDLQDLRIDSLRAVLGVVPQDISLFRRSVMENIRYGRPDAGDGEVLQAARQAHCLEFIERLPQGLDTLVGERGAQLSGGQRQRIGIARAFLKDSPILLLDEATSSLDSQSELLVKEALERLMRGRTVIAVAHRLSTLARYDRILVLDAGSVVQDGTLCELLGMDGPFRTLWRLQSDDAMRDGQVGMSRDLRDEIPGKRGESGKVAMARLAGLDTPNHSSADR
ncbi:ABC transporter ATP-binding protein [Achromobacter aloeverae]|nr:ABC transporter ATP-binding protein [Achromobacter aloeverae]